MLVQKSIEHTHHGYRMQFWSVFFKRDIEELEKVEG